MQKGDGAAIPGRYWISFFSRSEDYSAATAFAGFTEI